MTDETFFSYQFHKNGKALTVALSPHAKVLTTAIEGGGLRRDVTHLFNYDLKDANGRCELKEATYNEELKSIAKNLGLPLHTTVGMTTAVGMKDCVIKTQEKYGLAVTAIVTGGIENNGGCPGDPCGYREENDGFVPHHGTINIMLLIDGDLPDGILFRAGVTATEGKTAAIRDLLLPSCYSRDLATGSGTDGLFIITNTASPLKRTDAGKHSLLGELIGSVTRSSVKEALQKHMAKATLDMSRMENRLKRFGISEQSLKAYLQREETEKIWRYGNEDSSVSLKAAQFASLLEDCRQNRFEQNTILKAVKELFDCEDSAEKNFAALFYQYLQRAYDEGK